MTKPMKSILLLALIITSAALLIFNKTAVLEFAGICDDSDLVYKVCADQKAVYNQAFQKAKANNQIVLIKFGAEWCPWCHSLHKIFHDAEFMKGFGNKLKLVETALYKKKEKIPSGYIVLDEMIALSGTNKKVEGIPFLALINPQNKKVALIDTAELEQNTEDTKGHSKDKVTQALNKAINKVSN